MTQLWLKHRPDTLANMVGLDGLKADATSWAPCGVLRCGGVIFAGPPGTGKSSAARAIGKDLLGDTFSTNYHEFNASDDRSIAFVRDRLKPLAQQRAVGAGFKVINLDEADGLTRDAQDTMRQVIELTSPHVLWILTCNKVGRIIPALRSRLPTYTFKGLQGDDAEGFLCRVIDDEGFPQEWKESALPLITKHRGDLRACLKTLQICDPTNADSLSSTIRADSLMAESLYPTMVEGDWEDALKLAESIVTEGVSRDEVVEATHQAILEAYDGEEITQQDALKHLLILGQWAARSPDWTSGDILFLHSMIGDYYNRG